MKCVWYDFSHLWLCKNLHFEISRCPGNSITGKGGGFYIGVTKEFGVKTVQIYFTTVECIQLRVFKKPAAQRSRGKVAALQSPAHHLPGTLPSWFCRGRIWRSITSQRRAKTVPIRKLPTNADLFSLFLEDAATILRGLRYPKILSTQHHVV